ncbi:hypothetical protein OHT59_10825 [Streptomyces sp. NBC_00243]|uniref:hypothetical protein n=1 Tax=Streptomyces sp. NBC_00243 TaxID=2975688 RepID=UPI002DDAE605|nr:hypothetical protein [Streptomyces sp. NBC_00243]WRZ18937.1 hypothetical protein OHT59_10825 [Streptomyces sp. NBC_00243]
MARRRKRSTPQPPEPPQPQPSGGRPHRPPVGGIQPVEGGELPPAPPLLHTVPPPRSVVQRPEADARAASRFRTASSALAYAGQLPGADSDSGVSCFQGPGVHDWWVVADLSLEAVREMSAATGGRVYVQLNREFVRDRGWGGAPTTNAPSGQAVPLDALTLVDLLDLMRAAGLRTVAPAPLREAVLLLPGAQVPSVVRRALDLGLNVRYRTVRLAPLFPDRGEIATRGEATSPENGEEIVTYEVRLTASGDSALPGSLVTALERDPFTLVCRSAGDSLLMQHRRSSPLSDRRLEALAGNDVWLLADSVHGCSRLQPLADFCDGVTLVTLAEDCPLTNVTTDRVGGADAALPPTQTPVTLVRARTPRVEVDAVLLDAGDYALLPSLLAGRPLADAALLTEGRDRYLLTAPGGVLEQLPVGTSLYCLGPGNLFLPLGHRTQPLLPPTARKRLFHADAATAIVLQPQAILVFDLTLRRPVWDIWAGPLPEVDLQLPAEAEDGLSAVADLASPHPGRTKPLEQRPVLDRIMRRSPSLPRTWRDDAYDAELAGDLEGAADIHLRNRNPLGAARLLERAAQLG